MHVWERLIRSLENPALSIEGAMRLHICLVDYRYGNLSIDDANIDTEILQTSCDDEGISYMVLGNDVWNYISKPSTYEIDGRLNSLNLRDKVRLSFMDHEISCPRKSELGIDKYIRANRNQSIIIDTRMSSRINHINNIIKHFVQKN